MSSHIRCFLCRSKIAGRGGGDYFSVKVVCPTSKKPLETVITHLARSISAELELHISPDDCLCAKCFNRLIDYDAHVVRVLRKQRYLAQLLEKAAEGIDSDYEEDCNEHMNQMVELNDDHFFDDVDISDDEIKQTIHEAFGGTKDKQKPIRNRRDVESFHRQLDRGEILPCNFCAMEFKNKVQLQKHISQAHKKFSCEMCDFSHRNEDYVMLHMNVHEGRSENQCRFCEKEFTTKISTIRHMEVHFDTKKYQCDKCGLCFSQTTVLYNHKLQHEAEEQPLRCEICNQVFKTKRTFRHHMITHRADRPRYSCDFCGKTFTEKYTLKVHKRVHGNVDRKPAAAAAIAQQQQQHIPHDQHLHQVITLGGEVTVHTQPSASISDHADSKFTCIICDQPFSNKEQLNKHMEKEHDVILKSLTLSNFSQYDAGTQESKKPCHICGQMFSTQTNLDYHLENMHGVLFK